MTQLVNTVEIRIPKSKGKLNGKVISKRLYVYHFVNSLLENVLSPAPVNEIHALSERITDLILRKAKPSDMVRITVSLKYTGYVRIAGKVIGNYGFVLTIYVKDKVISVYEIKRSFSERLFDIEFRVPRKDDGLIEFLNIANFVINHGNIMPSFEINDEFRAIANYVAEYVKVYGKSKPRKVSDYHVIVNFARFVELLNLFHETFLSQETTRLIGTRFTYLAYKYLRDSGYFAYIFAMTHGNHD